MEGSSTSLVRWFQAIFLISQPGGISSSRLSKIITVTYKTAWLISHKIRHAISRADESELLSGIVQMQPIYYGYNYYKDAQQPLMIGGTTNADGRPHHVKIKQPDPEHVDHPTRTIKKTGILSFQTKFIRATALPIEQIPRKRYPYLTMLGSEMTNWLNDTFNGIGAKHLQAYLNEFCYRLNQYESLSSVFDSLLGWCAQTPVLIYKILIRHKRVLQVPWTTFGTKAKWKGAYLNQWGAS